MNEKDGNDIIEALNRYRKDNPIVYWMNGKEIEPKGFTFTAYTHTLPSGQVEYGNRSIYGSCTFNLLEDCGVFKKYDCNFECEAVVRRVDDEVIVETVKDNGIIVKQK